MSVESVLEHLGDVQILNKKDVFSVVVKVMEIIEKYKEAETGTEKKALAINVLKELIASSPIDEKDKEVLNALVQDEIISDTIDVIVKVAKGDYEITKENIKKGTRACILSCLKKK